MKKKTIIIGTVVFVLFGVIAWTLANNKKEIESRKEVKTTDNRIAVTVETAKVRETSSQLKLVGLAEPDKEVIVASESAGKIVQINFKLGDFVAKGAVLAKVDDTYKRLAYDNAQLNYNKYKDDYQRYQVLLKGEAVSENQLRDMKISFENATIQLENAKKQWDDTKIEAPFGGVITSKNTELGAYLNVGSSIAGMADIARLKVSLAVSESDVYQLRKGQAVSVSTNVYPNAEFKGNITSISPQGSDMHTYPVEILIANNSDNPLKAGTYVNVHIDLGKTRKALMIPRNAIVSSVKDPSVYVVKGETVQLVKISTGRESNSYLEVTSGINVGDQVVTNGQINLVDRAKIFIVK
nr:efflux RND transporter periplasmic adaptor subunit [uncultured Macellibacteroides sp.]